MSRAGYKTIAAELPQEGRDCIVVSRDGKWSGSAGRIELTNKPSDSDLLTALGLKDSDEKQVWVSEMGFAKVHPTDEWCYLDEAPPPTLEEAIEGATYHLMNAVKALRELVEGILEEKDGLKRAAHLAGIYASDYMAFVAALIHDGFVSEEAKAKLLEEHPYFDIDHETLMDLRVARLHIASLIRSGAYQPWRATDEEAGS